MIISQTVLEEKFTESEQRGLSYLLNNAETDEDVEEIEELVNFRLP